MLTMQEEILKKLSIEDLERINAYSKELTMGLQKIRTFPQGVTVFGSARLGQDSKYCQSAFDLGHLLAENGHAVITGGGPGIMEAVSHGAYEIGGRTIGFNIALAHEQFPNQYLTDYITFEYFFARKVMLAMGSKVFVFFPGGFGTMDELAEILCLMQEEKMPKMPVFLIGSDFWESYNKVIESMIALKLINEPDDEIFTVTDDISLVVEAANKIGHPKISENFYDGFREASAIARETEEKRKAENQNIPSQDTNQTETGDEENNASKSEEQDLASSSDVKEIENEKSEDWESEEETQSSEDEPKTDEQDQDEN